MVIFGHEKDEAIPVFLFECVVTCGGTRGSGYRESSMYSALLCFSKRMKKTTLAATER